MDMQYMFIAQIILDVAIKVAINYENNIKLYNNIHINNINSIYCTRGIN